jgi:hypothetical protein
MRSHPHRGLITMRRAWIFAVAAAVASLALTPHANAFSDCNSEAFVAAAFPGYAPADANGFQCRVEEEAVVSTVSGPVPLRIVRDADMADAIAVDYAQIAFEAGQASFQNLPVALTLKSATIVLRDPATGDVAFGEFKDIYGVKLEDKLPGECVVQVMPLSHETDGNEDAILSFKNTVAHELFHCIQAWNYSRLDGLAWLIEGTAEWYGHYLYEDSDGLSRRAGAMVKKSATTPFVEFTGIDAYSVAWFFLWVSNRDPKLVFDILKGAPNINSAQAQADFLVKALSQDVLDQFARDAVQGNIITKGKLQLPAIERVQPQDIVSGGQTISSQVKPGIIYAREIVFKGSTFAAEYTGTNAVSALNYTTDSWGSGNFFWAEPKCGDPEIVGIASFVTKPAPISFKITLVGGECEVCVDLPVRDQCLAGQWTVKNVSVLDSIADTVEPGALQSIYLQGSFGLKVLAGGEAKFVFDHFAAVLGVSAMPNGVSGFELDGTIRTTWSGANGKLQFCYVGSDASLTLAIGDTSTGVAGDKSSFDELIAITGKRGQQYSYTCEGNRMTLVDPAAERPYTLELERVAK